MKLFKLTSLIFLLVSTIINAQNLDSLFNSFIQFTDEVGIHSESTNLPLADRNSEPIKCGFPMFNQVRLNFANFNSSQKNTLQKLLSRFELQTSIVSPGGFFRVHFDTTGNNKLGYKLNDLLSALDSTYNFEIVKLGYPEPPKDNGEGGDDRYDVYILNLGNLYGYTDPETLIGDNKYTSFMVIDNDFTNHNTFGIAAASVTVAHEFHHAIQIGNYRDRQEDGFYYELTSTSFEEFVFDDVNDYYFYIRYYFNNTGRTFGAFRNGSLDGYDLAIWNLYIQRKYGYDIIKKSWEYMVNAHAVKAIEFALSDSGSTFKDELNKFGEWCFFTNYRSDTENYFSEGDKYPLVKPTTSIQFIPPQKSIVISSEPVSNNFLQFVDFSQGRFDTLVTYITNGDVQSGLITNPPTLDFSYKLSADSAGTIRVSDNYFYTTALSSSNTNFFKEGIILNNIPYNSGSNGNNPDILDFAYPQPFRYGKNNDISFPVAKGSGSTAKLFIYSISMNLIYSSDLHVISPTNKPHVKWKVLDNSGSKLKSGVYIFVTEAGENVIKGKIVIFNE